MLIETQLERHRARQRLKRRSSRSIGSEALPSNAEPKKISTHILFINAWKVCSFMLVFLTCWRVWKTNRLNWSEMEAPQGGDSLCRRVSW